MNEKPITFNQDFIPKLEGGTKTQTRRPKKTDIAKYQKGDILWVKEKWCYGVTGLSNSYKWQPASTMPKDAARIWLKVTAVRVERLCNISSDDLKKEGLDFSIPSKVETEVTEFLIKWDSIYKEKGYGWDTNPFVFVYEFEKINKE